MKSKRTALLALQLALLFALTGRVGAQWQTQSVLVKPGWSAIYLFVDASYTNLDWLVGSDPNNPIAEIWLWQPTVSSVQFVNNPLAPITGGSQWANWERLNTGLSGTMTKLAPNCAYLVHSLATTNYTWNLKGQPAAPNYYWNATAINLIGFPTVTNNPPALDTFLAPAPSFAGVATIYQYNGGDLSGINPSMVFAPHGTKVNRGTAFWINETNFVNSYFGPFQVQVPSGGTTFGTGSGSASIRLINTTPASVTVRLTLQPSETPPAGQTPIAGLPPIVVRGALNASNVTYTATALSSTTPMSWTLAPQGQAGSDIGVILGVNRGLLTNAPGALYAGILRFTDAQNLTEVDVPASAQPASYAGLWVGGASVSQVSQYLKTYQTNSDGSMAQQTNGAYVVTGIQTNLGTTASAFPMRLILHNDGTNVNLLQRVFYGLDINSNPVVATAESALDPAQLGSARRISSVEFPWTPTNRTWQFSGGTLAPGATISNTITVNYDDQSTNPFLHTYHPDHDNLDSTFQTQLPIGSESYQIDRLITLSLVPPGNDFISLVTYGQSFNGAYSERITMTGIGFATSVFNVAGGFTMNRLSSIAQLTRPQ